MSDICVPTSVVGCRAVSAVVRRGARYLLVLRANPPAQNMYAFPGGRIEAGETAAEAALRELEEETGIRATDPRPVATYDLTSDKAPEAGPYLLTVFAVRESGNTKPRPLDDAAAVGWFSIEEARRLPMPASMVHCLEQIEAGRSKV
ncbi:NUDIX domain-containing protein [Pseudohoeflea coraliihabitans]|uniref:NUDIX domain-containing protein n=1 Tax=Pseudohoeflea coraliihabitans TaxID=2860393 RepID=A0ABS6WR56_9HYPH|nr:NUDIX domain-containing protein [Pseudohoeflea sp. DP4N28-3]MBW3097887.1 NUDIX domain-containing protein [Pseudohoeflea sp. DP4N28-3]